MYRYLVHPYVPGFRYTRMHRVPVHPYAPEKKFYCSVGPAFHVCLTLPFGLFGCLGNAALIAAFATAISSSKRFHSLVAGRKLSGAAFCRAVRLR